MVLSHALECSDQRDKWKNLQASGSVASRQELRGQWGFGTGLVGLSVTIRDQKPGP
jgi:hypothetical protein